MSIKDFTTAIDIIGKVTLDYSYPQPTSRIKEVEKILNIKLPQAYSDFLIQFGSIKFNEEEIYGLSHTYDYSKHIPSTIVSETLKTREDNKEKIFPNYLVVIYAHSNGELSCLDTSQMNENGECPVVSWKSASIDGKELIVVAEDFGTFLLEKVQNASKFVNEEEIDIQ